MAPPTSPAPKASKVPIPNLLAASIPTPPRPLKNAFICSSSFLAPATATPVLAPTPAIPKSVWPLSTPYLTFIPGGIYNATAAVATLWVDLSEVTLFFVGLPIFTAEFVLPSLNLATL